MFKTSQIEVQLIVKQYKSTSYEKLGCTDITVTWITIFLVMYIFSVTMLLTFRAVLNSYRTVFFVFTVVIFVLMSN